MKAVIRNRSEAIRFIDRVCAELGQKWDKPYTITLTKFVRFRTLDQNAKFHAMINDLAAHIGYSPAELKDYIKALHGPQKVVKVGEISKAVPMGSSEWNVEKCSMMIEHLYRIAAEIGFTFEGSE